MKYVKTQTGTATRSHPSTSYNDTRVGWILTKERQTRAQVQTTPLIKVAMFMPATDRMLKPSGYYPPKHWGINNLCATRISWQLNQRTFNELDSYAGVECTSQQENQCQRPKWVFLQTWPDHNDIRTYVDSKANLMMYFSTVHPRESWRKRRIKIQKSPTGHIDWLPCGSADQTAVRVNDQLMEEEDAE